MTMKWSKIFTQSRKQDGHVLKTSLVRDTAQNALNKYQKTFKDLARYDRGEKVLDALPR